MHCFAVTKTVQGAQRRLHNDSEQCSRAAVKRKKDLQTSKFAVFCVFTVV